MTQRDKLKYSLRCKRGYCDKIRIVLNNLSVIIPTFNRCDLLRRTLDSAFAQDYPRDRFEILVVDNGSSDGTRDMLNKIIREESRFKIKYFIEDDNKKYHK